MARKHTPYYHQFMAIGAEMVDRIGFDSALRFTSVENEHLATRKRAGLYDVYYQVLVDIKGKDAEALLVIQDEVHKLIKINNDLTTEIHAMVAKEAGAGGPSA